MLEDETDITLVQFHSIPRLHFVHGLAQEIVFALPVAIEHAEDREQRGFPGARRAHDGKKISLLDIETDPAQNEGFAGGRLVILFEVS